MYLRTKFIELVIDDQLDHIGGIRAAAFALMPEIVAVMPTATLPEEGATVVLPDGGKITIPRKGLRGQGQGFLCRSYRCPGGGMDAPETVYLLLARKGEELVVALVTWERGREEATVQRVANRHGWYFSEAMLEKYPT